MTLWSIVYGCWVLLHMTCIVIIPCKEKYPTNLPLSPSFKIPTEFLQFYRMKYIESQGWCSAAVCTVAPLALALVHDDYEMVRSAHIVVNSEYLLELENVVYWAACYVWAGALQEGFCGYANLFPSFCFIFASASFFHFSESHPGSGGKHFLA